MKVEVTEGMESVAWGAHPTMKEKLEAVLAHPDCQRQLRDMVLAAVPPVGSGDWCVISDFVDGYNDHAEETIAAINRLFEQEPSK